MTFCFHLLAFLFSVSLSRTTSQIPLIVRAVGAMWKPSIDESKHHHSVHTLILYHYGGYECIGFRFQLNSFLNSFISNRSSVCVHAWKICWSKYTPFSRSFSFLSSFLVGRWWLTYLRSNSHSSSIPKLIVFLAKASGYSFQFGGGRFGISQHLSIGYICFVEQ